MPSILINKIRDELNYLNTDNNLNALLGLAKHCAGKLPSGTLITAGTDLTPSKMFASDGTEITFLQNKKLPLFSHSVVKENENFYILLDKCSLSEQNEKIALDKHGKLFIYSNIDNNALKEVSLESFASLGSITPMMKKLSKKTLTHVSSNASLTSSESFSTTRQPFMDSINEETAQSSFSTPQGKLRLTAEQIEALHASLSPKTKNRSKRSLFERLSSGSLSPATPPKIISPEAKIDRLLEKLLVNTSMVYNNTSTSNEKVITASGKVVTIQAVREKLKQVLKEYKTFFHEQNSSLLKRLILLHTTEGRTHENQNRIRKLENDVNKASSLAEIKQAFKECFASIKGSRGVGRYSLVAFIMHDEMLSDLLNMPISAFDLERRSDDTMRSKMKDYLVNMDPSENNLLS